MKRFLFNIFSFVLLFSIVYVIFLIIWGLYAPSFLKRNIYSTFEVSHLNRRLQEAKSINDVDILFLGSSHSYRGFDPRNFIKSGFKSFNLGSSSQTPIQTEILVEKYLRKMNPEIVILDVYPDLFANNGTESTLDLIVNEDIDFSTVFLALKINNLSVYNTLIFHSFTKLFNDNYKLNKINTSNIEKYISGGFVERDIEFYKVTELSNRTFSPRFDQLESFSRIVEVLKSEKIKFFLIYVPITKNQYNSYNNNDDFDSLMSSHGPYYNFNKLISLNDSLHFFDSHHLNQNGVNLFNEKLIDVLKLKK